jgi:RNA polymerase sigma factor (TIGR02999 family)
VYAELRQLAAAKMVQEKPAQTLQATALVHEAYIRLVGKDRGRHWNSRGHFFSAAAGAMRRILVEAARRNRGPRRGGDRRREAMELDRVPQAGHSPDVLAVDEALKELAEQDPPVAKLVELRFFGGLTMEEAASALGVSRRTADRYWLYAKVWLSRAIGAHDGGCGR